MPRARVPVSGTAPAPGRIPVWVYIVGAGGLFVAWYFLRQRQASASALTAAAASPSSKGTGNGGGASRDNATIRALQSEQGANQNTADIVSALSNLQPHGPTGAGKAGFTQKPWTGEHLIGSGYSASKGDYGVTSNEGVEFTYLQTANQIRAAEQAKLPLYYQIAPGTVIGATLPLAKGDIKPSTPLFIKSHQKAEKTGVQA